METILEFLNGLLIGIAYGALLCALLVISVVCLVEWKGDYVPDKPTLKNVFHI